MHKAAVDKNAAASKGLENKSNIKKPVGQAAKKKKKEKKKCCWESLYNMDKIHIQSESGTGIINKSQINLQQAKWATKSQDHAKVN